MKNAGILTIILVLATLSGGCTQTPAGVAEETPHVLANISNDISAMETPNITLEGVLQPLKTSVDYIQPASIVPTPLPIIPAEDPIVGQWTYGGDSGYQCSASFFQDSKAFASCAAGPITFAQRSFIWTPATSQYNWMRNYTLMDLSDNNNYTILYSDTTGRLTSEIIPGNGYFVKVG
jgi:hypothetical protein